MVSVKSVVGQETLSSKRTTRSRGIRSCHIRNRTSKGSWVKRGNSVREDMIVVNVACSLCCQKYGEWEGADLIQGWHSRF